MLVGEGDEGKFFRVPARGEVLMGAEDEEALAKASAAYDALTAQINNTEWMTAWRKARDAEDQGVKDFHNTPLTKEDLSDDGSEEYAQLKQAYEMLANN